MEVFSSRYFSNILKRGVQRMTKFEQMPPTNGQYTVYTVLYKIWKKCNLGNGHFESITSASKAKNALAKSIDFCKLTKNGGVKKFFFETMCWF